MVKYPPLSLSRSLQKTDGESKSGLEEVRVTVCMGVGLAVAFEERREEQAHQHMKSTLPSMPTRAQVRIFPIKP